MWCMSLLSLINSLYIPSPLPHALELNAIVVEIDETDLHAEDNDSQALEDPMDSILTDALTEEREGVESLEEMQSTITLVWIKPVSTYIFISASISLRQ
jgi:hypothetical protein